MCCTRPDRFRRRIRSGRFRRRSVPMEKSASLSRTASCAPLRGWEKRDFLYTAATPTRLGAQVQTTAVAELEDLPAQPCGGYCFDWSVRRADCVFQTPLWSGDPGSRPPPADSFGVTSHPTTEWIARGVRRSALAPDPSKIRRLLQWSADPSGVREERAGSPKRSAHRASHRAAAARRTASSIRSDLIFANDGGLRSSLERLVGPGLTTHLKRMGLSLDAIYRYLKPELCSPIRDGLSSCYLNM